MYSFIHYVCKNASGSIDDVLNNVPPILPILPLHGLCLIYSAGVMSWKKFPSQGLTSLSMTPTLTNVWVPRWSSVLSDDLLPSDVPPLYESISDADKEQLMDEYVLPKFLLLICVQKSRQKLLTL